MDGRSSWCFGPRGGLSEGPQKTTTRSPRDAITSFSFPIADAMPRINDTPGARRRRPFVRFLLLTICVFSIVGTIDASSAADNAKDAWTGFSTSCAAEDAKNMSISCHGVRIVRKIVQQMLETTGKEKDIELFDGVSLVEVPGSGSPRKARVLKGFGSLGPFLQFLEGRELRVKLPSLLPPNIETALQESLPSGSEGGLSDRVASYGDN